MSEKKGRKPLSPEQKADAARLKAVFSQRAKVSQAEFAHVHDLGSQGNVSQYLNGGIPLNLVAAAKFAKALGCKVEDFSPSLAAEAMQVAEAQQPQLADFALVRRVDVAVSAGHGELVFEEGTRSALTFRRSFLQEIGVTPASAVIVSVKGRSMEPTIPDGAVLLVSTTSTRIIDRQIYAFRCEGELFVKRFLVDKSGVKAVSDNPDRDAYPDMHIHEHDPGIEIIGRALWVGARL